MSALSSSIHWWHYQRWFAQTLTTGLPEPDAVSTRRRSVCISGTCSLEDSPNSVVCWIQVGAVGWLARGRAGWILAWPDGDIRLWHMHCELVHCPIERQMGRRATGRLTAASVVTAGRLSKRTVNLNPRFNKDQFGAAKLRNHYRHHDRFAEGRPGA